jgi:hypothetical protein
MNIRPLRDAPPPELAQALAAFEAQFTYPLGPRRFFRISHGDDYPRFYRAMGEAACFVAERAGHVLGTIGAALRRLRRPDGQERPVLYLGDLKIIPAARGGRTLPRLAQAVQRWVGKRTAAAFGVVMDGTPVTPLRYTGRLGLPAFQELGKILVLRLPTNGLPTETDGCLATSAEQGTDCYLRLSTGQYVCLGGDPAERSETEPLWLREPGGRACGRLEDTYRAKRLIADDGTEMRSAHLSCFAFADVDAGAELVRAAIRLAGSRGFPALFVAVAAVDAAAFCQALGQPEVVTAPATVYGAGLEPADSWNINTAEI